MKMSVLPLLAAVIIMGLALVLVPRAAFAQPETCWRCELTTAGTYECGDGYPSGGFACEASAGSCEVTGDDCSAQTEEDLQLTLQLEADQVLTMADRFGQERAYGEVRPGLFMSWDCEGHVVSVRARSPYGVFIPLPSENWAGDYSLMKLSGAPSTAVGG